MFMLLFEAKVTSLHVHRHDYGHMDMDKAEDVVMVMIIQFLTPWWL